MAATTDPNARLRAAIVARDQDLKRLSEIKLEAAESAKEARQ